ncbi:MAG: GNAT family N-acetyltransferase [Marinicaulis sp.]|nr:GNAT family N-acetyltransferase [Marinicaulis sp.]NNE41379.1 GNAT family N-acetyltransferase [Marinicaulis sp.]NNL89453.1 GNAT family N-acetyltransferase [Marinicaulis sp.]
MQYSIRRTSNVADAVKLAEIGATTFADTFGHLYSDADLEAFLRDAHSVDGARDILSAVEYVAWLAETDSGEVAGYCVAGPTHLPIPDKPDGAGELIRLYVDKAHRGGGLGITMLEGALDWLKQHFQHVYLSVYQENHGAQRLYRRYGFKVVHEYDFMVGSHADPEYIMKMGG